MFLLDFRAFFNYTMVRKLRFKNYITIGENDIFQEY